MKQEDVLLSLQIQQIWATKASELKMCAVTVNTRGFCSEPAPEFGMVFYHILLIHDDFLQILLMMPIVAHIKIEFFVYHFIIM